MKNHFRHGVPISANVISVHQKKKKKNVISNDIDQTLN